MVQFTSEKQFSEEQSFFDPTVFWAFFWVFGPKINFRVASHENKENRLFYFGLRNLLSVQNQLLDIENPKNQKIDSPYTAASSVKMPAIRQVKELFTTIQVIQRQPSALRKELN
jgi:hypothetical protein